MSERTWEYKVYVWNRRICAADDRELNNILNRFGNEGWELVSVIPQVGGSSGNVEVEFNVLIFKKQL